MLSTNAEIASISVALVNQTALHYYASFSQKLTHNMQARLWYLISVLALLHACIGMYNKLAVCRSVFHLQLHFLFSTLSPLKFKWKVHFCVLVNLRQAFPCKTKFFLMKWLVEISNKSLYI